MLDGMRKAAKGGIGRFVMAIVMGLIIVSFVIWGVGDMFRGFVSDKVAKVGSEAVTARQFENEMQNLIYQYQRRAKTSLTNAQVRAMGLDIQILQRLISDAALDQRARSLGLALSDETIAAAARSDPNLADSSGKFSRERFDEALRDSGLGNERAFFAQQRKVYLRQQLEYSLIDGVAAPKPLLAALAGAKAQARAIDYFTLPPSAAGAIPAPAPDVLKAFYDERKSSYKAPEYRGIDILLVTPASLAKPAEVSDEDAKATYEKEKDKFGTPEKRKLQQIVFPDQGQADEAEAKLKAGANFDDIAKARNLTDADLDLGEVAKTDIFDPAIADAAFSLPAGGVSGVVKGQFGFLIVRALSITPASVKPYDEVAQSIKQQIATQRAANDVQNLHDKIEDARVSGKSLVEAAKSVGLEARAIPAVDASGDDPQGAAVELPEKTKLLGAVFASDIGVDDAALNTKDRGYLWFSVNKVDPAHDRPFDEVKDKVESEWRVGEVDKALSAKAADLVKQLDAGAAIADLAKAEAAELKSAKDIVRAGGGGVAPAVAAAVFSVPVDKAGSAATPDGRVVFKITGDSTPPYDPADPAAKTAAERAVDDLRASIVDQYLTALKRELGVSVNEQVLRAAEGG